MNMFSDKQVRNLFIILAAILICATGMMQIIAHDNAMRHKNQLLLHDYEAAGYLILEHPELSYDIQKAFTSEKTSTHLQAGKTLMEAAGYHHGARLVFISDIYRLYRGNSLSLLIISFISGLLLLFFIWRHLNNQNNKLNQYSTDILKTMNGEHPSG